MNESYNLHLGYESEFILKNMNLVHSVANKYRAAVGAGISYEDLISEGTLGMIQAFRRYDPDQFDGKVSSFSTYAFPYIKGHIQRLIRDKRHIVRVPRRILDKANLIRKEGWTEDSAEVVAEKTGWDLYEVTEILSHINGWSVASLDQVTPNDKRDNDTALIDMLPSKEDFSSLDVREFLDRLSSREKRIIELRLQDLTQAQIGAELGISQAHVNRLLNRIQEKYIQFQNGELRKEEPKMHRAIEKTKAPLSHIVWFVDTGVPTMPSISVNGQGISFNVPATKQLGLKAGECVMVGLDPVDHRLVIRSDNQGLKLRSRNDSKGLQLTNKRLVSWMKKNKIEPKKYAIQKDPALSVFYAELEKQG